jgi:alpha-D-ribose 1-methylphosphonate 5-triphosphate diphosphatase PhnM
LGFFKGLKSIVSAPVSVVKGVGKAGWSGVKTVGKTLKSPKVVGAGTTVAGALTANPALITAGVGIVSSDYINQQRLKNAKNMAKSLNSASLAEAQNLEALYQQDTAVAGLQLESALANSNNVQTVADIPKEDKPRVELKNFATPVIALATIGTVLFVFGRRFVK